MPELLRVDPRVRAIIKEWPIFGAVSEGEIDTDLARYSTEAKRLGLVGAPGICDWASTHFARSNSKGSAATDRRRARRRLMAESYSASGLLARYICGNIMETNISVRRSRRAPAWYHRYNRTLHYSWMLTKHW